jgi:hypothetical protein
VGGPGALGVLDKTVLDSLRGLPHWAGMAVGGEGGRPGLRLPAWAARLIGVRRFCVPTLPALLSVPRPSSLRAGGG